MKAHNRLTDFREKRMGGIKKKDQWCTFTFEKWDEKMLLVESLSSPCGGSGSREGRRGKTATCSICQQLPAEAV